jgi:hypothetical protein
MLDRSNNSLKKILEKGLTKYNLCSIIIIEKRKGGVHYDVYILHFYETGEGKFF